MNESSDLVIANFVLPLIKDLLLPKISTVLSKFSNVKNSNKIERIFEEYLTQRYEHFLIIDTLVFPNKQTLFKELYEPLTVTDNFIYGNRECNEFVVDKYPENFISKYYRIIIEDTAGMGKTTISKKIFLSIVEQNVGIPILIELRRLNSKNKILQEIQRQLSPIGKHISQDEILKIINEGDFIFLFDGFDEIANTNRDFVIKELHGFIEKANNNYFLITSRAEDSLASFGDFQKFRIKSLKKEEAYSLINRYDKYAYKPIGKELIKLLEKNHSESLSEYLTNPLLVSLLYKSFDYKKDIPVKKSQFYHQVYDALFETHDLSKEGYLKRDKYSKLHIDDFERVLRYIGYFTAIENIVEYDKDFIINIIDKSKKHIPDLKFKSSDFLKDLLKTVPIFKQEGNNYRWSHKSLQDYFAAKFIWIDSKESRTQILRKIFELNENKRFYNILDIYYELDPNTFDSTITYWLLDDFCKFASCNISKFPDIPLEYRKKRIENSYGREDVLVVTKCKDYNLIRSSQNKKSAERHAYYRSKIGTHKKIGSISYIYFKTPKLIILNHYFEKRNTQSIIKLLSKRKSQLASYCTPEHEQDKLFVLKEDEAYTVNMEVDNPINNIDVFEIVNKMTSRDYTLSYDNAFRELERVKNIINSENDLLNW